MDGNWHFRIVDTGAQSAAWNMAMDEAILLQVAAGSAPPTIRFFAWEKPTISLGYFQRAKKEVDPERVLDRGYELVRRMTGGRAVLHDKELTYSVIVPGEHELARASVVESYRMLSEGLRQGFESLGLEAKIVSLTEESERAKFASLGSAACFDSPSWYELVVGGRKIAGSAQVRAHGGLLQHGSLLLDLDIDALFDVLLFKNEEERQRLRGEFSSRAASVKDLSGRSVTYHEAANAFRNGFAKGLPARLIEGALSANELDTAKRLVAEKYALDEWNFRR